MGHSVSLLTFLSSTVLTDKTGSYKDLPVKTAGIFTAQVRFLALNLQCNIPAENNVADNYNLKMLQSSQFCTLQYTNAMQAGQ